MIPHRTCEQRKVVVRGRTNCGRGCSFSFFVVMVSAMTIQKKTCCVKQHAVIDTVWGLLKGICGMSTVGRNYSLTRDTQSPQNRLTKVSRKVHEIIDFTGFFACFMVQ